MLSTRKESADAVYLAPDGADKEGRREEQVSRRRKQADPGLLLLQEAVEDVSRPQVREDGGQLEDVGELAVAEVKDLVELADEPEHVEISGSVIGEDIRRIKPQGPLSASRSDQAWKAPISLPNPGNSARARRSTSPAKSTGTMPGRLREEWREKGPLVRRCSASSSTLAICRGGRPAQQSRPVALKST